MPILAFVFLSAIITVAALLYITKSAFRNQLTNTITLADMKYCERKIKKQYRTHTKKNRIIDKERNVDTLDVEELAKDLSLKLQIVSDSSLREDVRAYLDVAPQNSGYNGIVCYVRNGDNDYEANFDIIHEIMHYLNDVGHGKKVTKSFARVYHGNQREYHEQMIDYYAAAVAIPKESLQERIRIHSGNPHDESFINELADIYKQPKETVKRRIGEVLALS